MAANTPSRILIIRPSALGDVCRTVPVAASLRASWPEASIAWVVQEGFSAAVSAHPAVDEVIPFPRARFGRFWRHPGVARELCGWLRGLRRRRFDLVIDGQGLGRSGLIAAATRAPRRVGPRAARELAWLAYTDRCSVPAGTHTVDAMLALVAAAGAAPVADMRLYVPDDDARWWRGARNDLGIGERRYAVLAPTARWASKRWPIERWAELAAALRGRRGIEAVAVIGAPSEHDQVDGLVSRADAGVVDLVGRTSVGGTMAVIGEAALVVANDSAPLHMAVGLDVPCVGLFGPTDPALVGPYGREEGVLGGVVTAEGVNYRSVRDDALMRRITVADVLGRIDAVDRPDPVRARPPRARTGPEGPPASEAGVGP